MLKKVFKHDCIALGRLLIPFFVICLLLAPITGFVQRKGFDTPKPVSTSNTQNFVNFQMEFTSTAMTVIYILALVALYIVTTVFIIIHFYKTMVGGQAYLTHTLPIKTSVNFLGKILSGSMYTLVSIIVILISILLLLLTDGILEEAIKEFQPALTEAWNAVIDFGGASIYILIAELIVLILLSCVSGILQFYTSIAIGQSHKAHPILASCAVYFCMYMLQQFLSGIFSFCYPIYAEKALSKLDALSMNEAAPIFLSFIAKMYGGFILYSIVIIFVLYTVGNYFFTKKLNLD